MACWMGLFFDFLCFIAVGLPIILFKVVGEPYHRGFYCTDQSIGKPYKEGTVHSNVLYSVGFGLTCLVMIFTELWYFKRKSKEEKLTNTVHLRVGRLTLKLNSLVVCLLELIAVFAFGAAVNILVTDVGKYTIGRLRPHFLSVCEPDPAVVWNCTATTYITGEVCTGDPVLIHKARLSFPSGHSSFSGEGLVPCIGLYNRIRIYPNHKIYCLSEVNNLQTFLGWDIYPLATFGHHSWVGEFQAHFVYRGGGGGGMSREGDHNIFVTLREGILIVEEFGGDTKFEMFQWRREP